MKLISSRTISRLALAAMLVFGGAGWSSATAPETAQGNGAHSLEGTIWVGTAPHRRVTVTTDGDVQIKEGKDIYVRFVSKVDDIYVIEVRWWNETANINVLEYGVLTRILQNEYRYIESDHHDFGLPRQDFPGIVGRGTFELTGRNRAKLVQIGHLVDGSASGFTAYLERSDSVPTVDIPQTYP
jgi:hypothetical protein